MDTQSSTNDTKIPKIQNTPSENIHLLAIVLGIIIAIALSTTYNGNYIIPDKIVSFFANSEPENITPPNVGFDRTSNIDSIPQELFDKSEEIKVLVIEASRLKEIPKQVEQLANLVKLQIKDSKLTGIPNEVSSLTNLETLDLGGNKITNTPDSLANLQSLKKLLLYDNNISQISESLANLKNLEVLDLRNNKLESLPLGLSGLTNLKFLFLGGNKINEGAQEDIRNMFPSTQVFF